MRAPGIVLISLLVSLAAVAEAPPKWALLQHAIMIEQDGNKVRSLVAEGVDLNDPIGCGTFAPLDGAVGKGNVELVRLLLSLGAKPRERQIVYAAAAPNHQDALNMVRLLRSAGVSINARDYYLKTGRFTAPIHAAVYQENVELVRYLLKEPDLHLNEFNVDGYTPLMIAVEKGNSELFDMLLAAGASPTIRNAEGLDAARVAEGIVSQQEHFLERLKQH